jgi:hypothetical protein
MILILIFKSNFLKIFKSAVGNFFNQFFNFKIAYALHFIKKEKKNFPNGYYFSNILIISTSGKVAHIDFGDSFEAAMHRENVPEKVPFRLTRMLVNAMEVTGVNGTYKKICQDSMKMCRANKESILAVLEAFILGKIGFENYGFFT